jgi:prepilin-type processing-associated H-X9-DG protein
MNIRIWTWNWSRILAWATLVFFLFCGTAIIYPNFVCARVAARSYICLSNIKSQGQAMFIYAVDNNDCLPDAEQWMDKSLEHGLKKDSLRCPSLPDGKYGYAFMEKLERINSKLIEAPAKTLMVIESTDTCWNAHGDIRLLPKKPRHSGCNTICFADGHAKKVNDFELRHLPRQ